MIFIENFLPQDKLEELKAILATCKYVDGIETAGGAAAKDMKSNLQVDHKDPNGARANEYVLENVKACTPLQAYALPYKIGPITFSRYHEGMKYNNHIDAAIMPMPGAFLRTDVSFTIFLTGPDEYEGGELVIISDSTEKSFKGTAGTLVAYSSGLLHRVNEVRSGSREVAIGWLQSLVEGNEKRQILYDMLNVRSHLQDRDGKSKQSDIMARAYINLLRMWAQP